MATQPSNGTSELLKYKTWVLRVPIHCEGCKRKVHKILHNIDGVFTVSIDSQENKVSVTGNVEAEKLIKKLEKSGKHAQILHEKFLESENKTGTSKKKKKNPDNEDKASGDEEDDQENNPEEKEENKKENENDDGNEKPNPTNTGAKKKKKKRGKKGNNTEGANTGDAPASTESFPATETLDLPIGMMHLGPPFGHVYTNPTPYYPAQPFGMSYSTTHPRITSSYYRPPPPSDRIRMYEIDNHDEVYVGNDDEGGCSIM